MNRVDRQKLADLFADIQLYLTATAVKQCMQRFQGNDATHVVRVLAPKLLKGKNIQRAHEKERAGTFRFITPDGTGITLRPLQ